MLSINTSGTKVKAIMPIVFSDQFVHPCSLTSLCCSHYRVLMSCSLVLRAEGPVDQTMQIRTESLTGSQLFYRS